MRKRSTYRPKGVRLDVMTWMLQGMVPIRHVKDQIFTLRIKNHDALKNACQGVATRANMNTLFAAMNMAEALVTVANLGDEYAAEVRAGLDALDSMGKRGLAKGDRFIFTAPELNAVNLAMEIHDAQIDICTVAELEKCVDHVVEADRKGTARKLRP